MTSLDTVKTMLLNGMCINKFDLLSAANSVCLAQRVNDLRNEGWNVQSKSIKGKGTLRCYWLDPEEIDRLNG